jgi:hypothetical protein
MKIQFEDLEKQGYTYLETMEHNNIAKFLKPYIQKINNITIIYYSFTLMPFLIWLIIIGLKWFNNTLNSDVTLFFTGFSLAFLLVPFHEYLHGFAYRYVGAQNVSYGADFKKFVFYALADKFVANEKEFQIIALTPFIVITTLAILSYFIVPTNWSYMILGLIFTHSLFCGGDFGLLSYFLEHKDKNIVTYDDVANKVSHFYFTKKL